LKTKLLRFWNLEPLGIFIALFIILKVTLLSIYEKISSFFWKYNLGKCGLNVIIQKGTSIRYPKNIFFGRNISVGRGVNIFSEFVDGQLTVLDRAQINKNVELDFSGNLKIGKNVVISEFACIMTHNHGLVPKSKPIKNPKIIYDNVWIGARAILLPQAETIGENSIIAAGAVVTKDVPPNCIVAGNPARIIRNI
tara:strand:- start:892 stop:1476 length:585 start_codon:yes stop_codon:yes gene_type:complete